MNRHDLRDRPTGEATMKSTIMIPLRAIGLEDRVRRIWWAVRLWRKTCNVEAFGTQRSFWSVNQQIQNRLLKHNGEDGQLGEFLESIREGDTIWDVGAHVGLFSLFASCRIGSSGKVFAFEPEKRTFRRLQRNCALNKVNNIEALPLALGDEVGHTEIFLAGNDPGRIGTLARSERHRRRQRILMDTGDHLVSTGKVPLPNVLKIDVEGAEYRVLNGMRATLARPECRYILLEVHPGFLGRLGHTPGDLEKMNRQSGFTLKRRWKRGSEEHWSLRKDRAGSQNECSCHCHEENT